jgi:hemoglobin
VTTIYEDIGGEGSLKAAVDDFYRRVLGDPELAPYFEGIDMVRLKRHQVAFFTVATGGPQVYAGRDMAEAHAGLNITEEHFDRVVGHLVDTLSGLGVPAPTIEQIGGALTPLKPQIVGA